jgi:putative tryptophan/tyrosine transport system substrate-binding protein
MRRREFIAGLGGAAAWPLVARAQQPDRMRRIGVLMQFGENYPLGTANFSAFMQGLAELGWKDGRNVRMDVRWAEGSVDRMRMFAKELVDRQISKRRLSPLGASRAAAWSSIRVLI